MYILQTTTSFVRAMHPLRLLYSLGAVYMERGIFLHQEELRRRKNFSLGLHAEIVVRAVNRREGIKEQR